MCGLFYIKLFMPSLIHTLVKYCSEYYFVEYNRILFDFKEFLIILNFHLPDETENKTEDFLEDFKSGDFGETTLEDLPIEFISNIQINDLFISDSEYLGYREDILSHAVPEKSIALKLFYYLKIINGISPSIILSYNLDINYGYNDDSGYCPVEPNYIFQIFIDYESLDLPNLLIYFSKNKIEEIAPNYLYFRFLQEYKQIDFKKEVSIINTNTKVRRLGYLVLLADFFQSQRKIPLTKINKRFEDYASNFEKKLLSYSNTRGLIKKSKTGISAQPYITLAKEIDWVSKVHNVQVHGKLMKVYQILKTQLEDENDNPFHLSKLERLFFLEILLLKDFFYLSSIIELLFINPDGSSYAYLRDNFQNHLVNRLEENIREIQLDKNSTKLLRKLRKIKERIVNWENAPKYMEHVLMPRLNWLYDLQLVGFNQIDKKATFQLTSAGEKLFHHFCFWMDVNYSFIIDPSEFLKRFFVHTFDSIYHDENEGNDIPVEVIRKKISEYLNESFDYFKTLAPNRVTASQALTFTKYKLYCKDRIKIGQKFIEDYLKEHTSNLFIYKFQEQYNDGYIQKVKK